jgi:primosomal protein N' (replication factor Y)
MGCRYCGHAAAVPELCPACRGAALAPVGGGTERLEGLLRELFPSARVGRLDRDTARTGRQADIIRRGAAAGEFDILVGTQMLFQGAFLPLADLVGVLCADAGLHLPDFRSAERCYQVLSDVVALAKPAAAGGRVLLQTHFPGHHAIAAIGSGDPAVFYQEERELRAALGYPPFTSLISLSVSGRDPARVKAAAQEWAGLVRRNHLHAADATLPDLAGDAVLGPIPSAVPKGRGRSRWQMLVKGRDGQALRQAVKTSLDTMEDRHRSKALKFEVDVDPVEML